MGWMVCHAAGSSNGGRSEHKTVVPPDLRQQAALHPLEHVASETNSVGECVFNVEMEALIESYNGYCYADNKARYLRAPEKWQKEAQPAGMHFQEETNAWTYCIDFSKWTLPRMTAYVSTTDGKLREVMCNYDDHSYSPQTFDMYEEMSA